MRCRGQYSFADLNKVEGKTFGQMLIELPDQEQVAQRMLAYLELHHIHFEEETPSCLIPQHFISSPSACGRRCI